MLKLTRLHLYILDILCPKRCYSFPSIRSWVQSKHSLATDKKITRAINQLERENYVAHINGGYIKNPNGQLAMKRHYEENHGKK